MNKKQCLATKYQKTEIKPNKITALDQLKRKEQRPSLLSRRSITLNVLKYFNRPLTCSPYVGNFFISCMIFAYSFRND